MTNYGVKLHVLDIRYKIPCRTVLYVIKEKLVEMGITLPNPPSPAGAYVPVAISNGTAFVSGQIPISDGKVQYTGKVGDSNIMDAKKSARLCAINILAQLEKNLGSLERVEKIIRINGFVNSQPDFTAHPKVIDAASDLMYSIFGDKGKHSRIAIGVQSLPLDSMTEIDALVQIC